ncbi:MAG: hypothetical protein R3275_12925, partial [Saprospiraceae bacterium]|nr:hypothetical protein [Saprospiraceae bacterium]
MIIFNMNRTLDNDYSFQQNSGKVVSTVVLIFAISFVAHTQKAGNTSRMTGPSGQEYETVRIGDQVWLKENLNTKRFKNGEYYGKLYNWHAVSDPRGICPEG